MNSWSLSFVCFYKNKLRPYHTRNTRHTPTLRTKAMLINYAIQRLRKDNAGLVADYYIKLVTPKIRRVLMRRVLFVPITVALLLTFTVLSVFAQQSQESMSQVAIVDEIIVEPVFTSADMPDGVLREAMTIDFAYD